MKSFSLFSLLLLAGAATLSSALTAQEVNDECELLQSSRPAILNQGQFAIADSYQSKAKQAAVDNLANVAGYQKFQVRQYYVLACLFFATNGVSNPRYFAAMGDEPVAEWVDTTGWITEPNYCLWFGIRCFDGQEQDQNVQNEQEANLRVVEINLAENDLSGVFPNEIALLSVDLLVIDLFDNFHLWCIDYRWMNAMRNLEALYFGTTSFDADGIPFVLRFMTNLQELDFSNTFWRGTLTENAFNNLKKLFYLDIGRSFLDIEDLTTIPAYITGLPLLAFLKADRIKPTDPNAVASDFALDLSFMGKMPNLELMWIDFTNVVGPIPEDIGNAKNLRSFSAVYCKLTGSIPNSIVNTNMQEMWLYGNPELGGDAFPVGFATLPWRRLFLEGCSFSVQLPKDLCDLVGPDEFTQLFQLGADCDVCPTAGCCTCCGDDCNNLRTPTPAPTPEEEEPPAGPVFCFSGNSQVEVEHKGFVLMSDLKIGDAIKVMGGDGNVFEPVYSFGHKNKNIRGDFLAIHVNGNKQPLELSPDHMVATTEGGRMIPASMVQIGDFLLTGASGDLAVVTMIRTVKRTGVYAPFTNSGSLIVNNIVASNYVAFQGREYYTIAGSIETPFDYHWIAHIFQSVQRIAYKMGLTATEETYTEDGTSTWVSAPRDLGLWLLNQNPIVMVLGLAVYICIFGSLTLMESYPLTLIAAAAALAVLVVVRRRSSGVFTLKMKKM